MPNSSAKRLNITSSMISYGSCSFSTLQDREKKRRTRKRRRSRWGQAKRRDGEECRGKMLSNGRRTRRKHRSWRCRKVNSKWNSEEGDWMPQYFSYCFLLLSYPLLDSGFGVLAVSMLASGTRVRGFKHGCQIFSGVKILSMPSFGREVKPSVPCRRFAAR
jgi:hypothetical protein